MRYLVMACVKAGRGAALARAIDEGTLGKGSVAGDEYLHDMKQARLDDDGTVRWVEVCFCPTPLAEERPYWEEYFELLSIKDAHSRKNCRDLRANKLGLAAIVIARSDSSRGSPKEVIPLLNGSG
jgi:hypothetical protein